MKAVQDSLEEFKQLGCKVVVVTSGSREDGLKWRERFPDNKIPNKLVDSDWVLYRKLNLRRYCDILSTWAMGTYADKNIRGIPLPVLEYVDDLWIMGGDFIVRQDGLIVYALHQRTFYIRPSNEELFSALKELH